MPFYEERIEKAMETFEPDEIIWLGLSPLASWCYSWICGRYGSDRLKKGLRIADNNPRKQGMSMPAIQRDDGFDEITVRAVEECADNPHAVFFVSNPHRKSYLGQLVPLGIKEERVIDLYQNEAVLHGYFREEVDSLLKHGYKRVKERELQMAELETLKFFHNFCEDNGLRYYMAFGTLLGAARHKGFIPWDDDIDVFMPYEDYVRMMEIFPGDGRFRMADYRFFDTYQWQFAKLMDSETSMLHNGFTDMYLMGINMDIFPLCGYPAEQELYEAHIKRNMKLDYEWQLGHVLSRTGHLKSRDYIDRINSQKFAIPFDEAAGFRGLLVMSGRNYTIPADCFKERVLLDFEGERFYAPVGYKEFLSRTYNDYMTVPDPSKQKFHGYPSYLGPEAL